MKHHMHVLAPADGIFAFYDGRVPGYRFAPEPNWVDQGAIELGIASYAIVQGHEALVYDTHVSPEHGRLIRAGLEAEGVTKFTVVLSHWHLDHVAGTTAFPDAEVIANARTAAHLEEKHAAIEDGTLEGPPAINPLVMPTRVFSGTETLEIGGLRVELIEANIHSDDATVVWLPGDRILLCGDTMEDTVTYVDAPADFAIHLAELDRLEQLDPHRILPCHGDPDVIATGGYTKGLIRATQQYIRTLERCRTDEELRARPLESLIAGPLEVGWINYFEPYESVHQENLANVLALNAAAPER